MWTPEQRRMPAGIVRDLIPSFDLARYVAAK